ncbi:ABC transporter permease [Ruminiclostridium josui]|uniref:ABC transporter permease n=1 Tax=Ruminiclostridium josui TaxID=1499 RepID=UPI0004668CD9|nr:ABC transporter permease [Ruminiclostridium josui]
MANISAKNEVSSNYIEDFDDLNINLFEKANKVNKKLVKSNIKSQIRNIIYLLIAPVFVLLIWELGCKKGFINTMILPSPSSLLDTTIHLIENGKLGGHLKISGIRVVQGFLIGTVSGVVVGSIMGLSRSINKILSAFVGILRPIPMIAWIPLLILWMGIDEESKIAVIVIGSFWPVLINTIHGIQSVDLKLLEVAKILEKSTFEILIRVIFPSALPAIFTGIRLGMGSAWTCVVAAEMIAAAKGIGYMIMYARELSQPDVVFVGVISIGIIGLLIDTLILKLQNKVLIWNIME